MQKQNANSLCLVSASQILALNNEFKNPQESGVAEVGAVQWQEGGWEPSTCSPYSSCSSYHLLTKSQEKLNFCAMLHLFHSIYNNSHSFYLPLVNI